MNAKRPLVEIIATKPAPEAFIVKPGETLVIRSHDDLDMATFDMLTSRLGALGVQFVLVGPNFSAVSEPQVVRDGD